MTFAIELLPEAASTADGDRTGCIQVGTFCELFVIAPVPGQDVEDLPEAWQRELHRLLGGADAVALRTQPHEVWVVE